MGRVSPVFDSATKLLIVEVEDGWKIIRTTIEMVPIGAGRRLPFLLTRNIQTILCGAISQQLQDRLSRAGIRIRAFLAGDAYQLISAYIGDSNNLGQFMQPGGRRRQQRGRGRCRHGCARGVRVHKSTREEF